MKMKPKANKKWRNRDYRFIVELETYAGLSKEELDIAIHGIPFRGKRYPLCYVFWPEGKYRQVSVTLTKEVGTLIGENLIELPRKEQNIHRGIVLLQDGRVTDLSYSVIRFM
jgi:hypothetical protein